MILIMLFRITVCIILFYLGNMLLCYVVGKLDILESKIMIYMEKKKDIIIARHQTNQLQ
jgi:hypothetical protein